MLTPGLRFDQAPPFGAPLRFFLTAPLHPLLAGGLLLWSGPEAFASRWSPELLAITHLLVLGFVTQVMFGALLQMLPVVAAASVPRPRLVAASVHVTLNLGTLALSLGFLADRPALFAAALVLLGASFALFLAVGAAGLARAPLSSTTTRAMGVALLAAGLTALLGMGLSADHAGLPGLARLPWTDVHLAWGLLGWISILVVGVAYQVVPMFQLTPAYPTWFSRAAVWLLLGSTALAGLARMLHYRSAAALALVAAAGVLAAFALTTLRLLRRRRRRVADVTTRFWTLAMLTLLACLLAVLWERIAWLPRLGDRRVALLVGTWFVVGFASSVIHGMLYKIAPFLGWLHLQRRHGGWDIPNMKELLPTDGAERQFRVHAAALLLLTYAIAFPDPGIYPAAAALALSYMLLGLNLLAVVRRYRTIDRSLAGAADVAPGARQRDSR